MRLVGAAAPLLLLPLSAAAQRITVTPQVGLYAPLRSQAKWVENVAERCVDDRGSCPVEPVNLQTYRLDLQPGLDLGVKLVVEWDGLGLESFVSSAALTRQVGYAGSERHAARNTVAGLRFTYRRPLSARSDLTVGGGLSSTALSSSSYCVEDRRCIADRTPYAITPGAALGIGLTPSTRFELSVVDYIYTVRYPRPLPRFVSPGERFFYGQHDLVISAGLGIVVRQ